MFFMVYLYSYMCVAWVYWTGCSVHWAPPRCFPKGRPALFDVRARAECWATELRVYGFLAEWESCMPHFCIDRTLLHEIHFMFNTRGFAVQYFVFLLYCYVLVLLLYTTLLHYRVLLLVLLCTTVHNTYLYVRVLLVVHINIKNSTTPLTLNFVFFSDSNDVVSCVI